MILAVGLSSVWQRTLFFNGFCPGEVNRATRVLETASGKGVNVARVATLLGAKAMVLTTAGGTRGDFFRHALKADKVPATIIPIAGETRICQTLVGLPPGKRKAGDPLPPLPFMSSVASAKEERAGVRGSSPFITEIVEESPALSPREVEAVLSAYSKTLRKTTIVILSGTVPAGCGDAFYAELAREANRRGIPVLVDTQRAQLLQVVREKPSLVKINRAELAEATGHAGVAAGVRELMKLGAQRVVISQGSKPSRAFDGTTSWQVSPPRISVINPIGSGDAMMAGMAVALSRGSSLKSALRLGVACGAANALTETSGVIREADLNRLKPLAKPC